MQGVPEHTKISEYSIGASRLGSSGYPVFSLTQIHVPLKIN